MRLYVTHVLLPHVQIKARSRSRVLHKQRYPAHLDVWVQRLDVCCNACNQAATANRHKDGIKLGGVCYLQPPQQQSLELALHIT
jgi:hypothetical protein